MTNEEIKEIWENSGKTLVIEWFKDDKWIDCELPEFYGGLKYRFKNAQNFSVINDKVKNAWLESGKTLTVEGSAPDGSWREDSDPCFYEYFIYRIKPGEKQVESKPAFKDVIDQGQHYRYQYRGINLDPYRILMIYGVTSPALQQIVKKALCAGRRGHNDYEEDLKDIISAAQRELEIINEDRNV